MRRSAGMLLVDISDDDICDNPRMTADSDVQWKQDRIGTAHAGTNPTVLAKLPQSFAAIGDTQFLPGYCVLLVDDPSIDRLTDLPRSQRLAFLESMEVLGEAVQTACTALDSSFVRMNYEILGNTDHVLHAHLFPRYGWEPEERLRMPVWLYGGDQLYGADSALGPQHDTLRASIVSELSNLGFGTDRN